MQSSDNCGKTLTKNTRTRRTRTEVTWVSEQKNHCCFLTSNDYLRQNSSFLQCLKQERWTGKIGWKGPCLWLTTKGCSTSREKITAFSTRQYRWVCTLVLKNMLGMFLVQRNYKAVYQSSHKIKLFAHVSSESKFEITNVASSSDIVQQCWKISLVYKITVRSSSLKQFYKYLDEQSHCFWARYLKAIFRLLTLRAQTFGNLRNS